MSVFTNSVKDRNKNILKIVKSELKKNGLSIKSKYVEPVVKVLYGFCKSMYPDVKNINSRHSLFCSDKWIAKTTFEFFENFNDQAIEIMENLLEENEKYNEKIKNDSTEDPKKKDIFLKKIILENILGDDEDDNNYQKNIAKFHKNNEKISNHKTIDDVNKEKYNKYLQYVNSKYTGVESVDGGRSRKRNIRKKQKTKKSRKIT